MSLNPAFYSRLLTCNTRRVLMHRRVKSILYDHSSFQQETHKNSAKINL